MKKFLKEDENINLILEDSKFITQYRLAVLELLKSKNSIKFIYPIINLIHQTIELELKNLIMNNYNESRSLKELQLVSTKHPLYVLIEHSNIKLYYDGIPEIECEFTALNKCVHYFSELLGDNTYQKCRYAIDKEKNVISKRKKIDFEELKKQWNIYSLLSAKIHLIHMAYSIVNDMQLLLNNSNDYDSCKKVIISEVPQFERANFERYINLYEQRKKT